MTTHKSVVEAYIDGFRRLDHPAILACLTDDIEWIMHGYRTLQGRPAFDAELKDNPATGAPTLNLDHLIEEGDTVVAVGNGSMLLKEGSRVAFVFSEVFTFAGDRIRRIETFHINLSAPGGGIFDAPSG
jgi:ketosteroid isomerase-like protein